MKRALCASVVAIGIAVRACGGCHDQPPRPVNIATFNIENFPKHARQIEGAFAEIAALDVPIVAVQEISDPELFAREAQHRLGPTWRCEFAAVETSPHQNGVVFDRRVYRHVATREHDATRLGAGHKPVLDVELAPADGGPHVRVLVVHFKAGGENQPIRHRQYVALRGIVDGVRQDAHATVVVLGDFNATGEADRRDLAALAAATRLRWTTEPLACSAFWNRDDGCPRSRLDHVLATEPAGEVRAGGACATQGCGWQDRCPIYAEEVSDHCPVVVGLTGGST